MPVYSLNIRQLGLPTQECWVKQTGGKSSVHWIPFSVCFSFLTKLKLWFRKIICITWFSVESPPLEFPPNRSANAPILPENGQANNRDFTEDSLLVYKWEVTELHSWYTEFSFKTRPMKSKKIVVPGFPSNTLHSSFHQLGLPTHEFSQKIECRIIDGLLNSCLKIPKMKNFRKKFYTGICTKKTSDFKILICGRISFLITPL